MFIILSWSCNVKFDIFCLPESSNHMSKKSCPILYTENTVKTGQDFFDIQYNLVLILSHAFSWLRLDLPCRFWWLHCWQWRPHKRQRRWGAATLRPAGSQSSRTTGKLAAGLLNVDNWHWHQLIFLLYIQPIQLWIQLINRIRTVGEGLKILTFI